LLLECDAVVELFVVLASYIVYIVTSS